MGMDMDDFDRDQGDRDPDLCSGGAFEDDPPPAEGSCDVVLVDAPCSSTGVLRRRPSLRWTLDPPQALAGLPEQQKELLVQAQVRVWFVWNELWLDLPPRIVVRPPSSDIQTPKKQAHVKRGGVLVYATCSLLSQENEQVAHWFLREFGDRFCALDWEGEVRCGDCCFRSGQGRVVCVS